MTPPAAPGGAHRNWYVLQCEPLCERAAHKSLHDASFTTYLPMTLARRTRGNRRVTAWVPEPMFPGYLPIKLDLREGSIDAGRIEIIHRTRGIRAGAQAFLKFGACYAVLPEDAYQHLCRLEWVLMHPQEDAPPFEIGETVRIEEGPFAGFNADIEAGDGPTRSRVLVEMLGRCVPTTIPNDWLAKL